MLQYIIVTTVCLFWASRLENLVTALLETTHNLFNVLEKGKEVGAVYLILGKHSTQFPTERYNWKSWMTCKLTI